MKALFPPWRWRASRTQRAQSFGSLLSLSSLLCLAVGSCFAEPGPVKPLGLGGSSNEGGASTGGSRAPIAGTAPLGGEGGEPAVACGAERPLDEGARCRTMVSGEPLLARIPDATPMPETKFTSDLFEVFKSTCGTCHVAAALGDPPFQVTSGNIADVIDSEVLAVIRSTDPEIFMPPPPTGMPFDQRPEGDSVRKLANWIEVWLEQGSPKDFFQVPAGLGDGSSYVYDSAFAETFTSVGTCIPESGLVATEAEQSCDVDARFVELEKSTDAEATDAEWVGLPPTLDQTDLFTLDSEELAKHGVISFAPAYPLWSDGAGKMRHVRVPRGQSIRFDKETQTFDIPANTRFYKTFLKEIVDKDGVKRMKKMETRLIVSRPDRLRDDGTYEVQALFGTYVWNDQETRAELLLDWQRDQKPFSARVIKYITDEPEAKRVLDNLRPGRDRDLALTDARVVRHYGIPGRQQCVECHMGSPGHSFVLGFTPLQMRWRPEGEGGVIQPTDEAELTQLERLIDYGVITGIRSTDDVVLLEDSQGDRHPRTNEELIAQGYLFGNCAHCHNPNGFASTTAPELAELLDFWPAEHGGVFEFPLDRVSPRIRRGKKNDKDLPYITPSLRDIWPETPEDLWTRKGVENPDDGTINYIDAPWRSVIYRNVDTPFIYPDDYAFFPHMPRNTAGYDCRAPRILADWMVSIPALRTNPLLNEDGVPAGFRGATGTVDNASQPYREVRPDEPEYDDAVAAAAARLEEYHSGERYGYCVDQTDIVDREVLDLRRLTPQDLEVDSAPYDGVPDRVHWVFVDETEAPGDWFPRRPDWKEAIVDQAIPEVSPPELAGNWAPRIRYQAEVELVGLLEGVKVDDVRSFALAEFPMGAWVPKEGCDFSSVKKLSEISPAPRWAFGREPTTPVYSVLPGEAIFNMICVNCHGRNADSRGAKAGTLSELTGGFARVANFRDGLFGTNAQGVLNRVGVFDDVIRSENLDVSAEDLAGHYMAWMALGGTKVLIPREILVSVGNTEVLGARRSGAVGSQNLSANMLSVAQELCQGLIGLGPSEGSLFRIDSVTHSIAWNTIYDRSGLILTNGDAELWETLCNLNNPSPVRALASANWAAEAPQVRIDSLYRRSAYPIGAPVGNHDARIEASLQPTNRFPWCILEPPTTEAEAHAGAVRYASENAIGGQSLPFCPSALLADANLIQRQLTPGPNFRDNLRAWTARGAVNAGLAVFLYLQRIHRELETADPPAYDHCEELEGD